MTPEYRPKYGPSWEDVPLVDLPGETVEKKPAKRPAGVRWSDLKHRRWVCAKCVQDITRLEATHPRKAEAVRDEGEDSVAYCGIHAGDQKVEDEREGKWRAQR